MAIMVANLWPSPNSGHRQILPITKLWPSPNSAYHQTFNIDLSPRSLHLLLPLSISQNNMMQAHSSSPTYLYFPDKNKVLRILQLPSDPHPFVGFTEHFRLIGYLANANRELSPLYRAEHASMNSEHSILDIVGILAVPSHNRVMFSEVYEKKRTGDGNFLRSIDSELCRPNVLGATSVVWPMSITSNAQCC
ncbi:hypothetical protein P692DRAFT_20881872 [Suillus brevipes Sb2]|nr:hypothetical protein P692DRAFT_20881872 [Suillus brevipes Sb2]